MGLNANILAVCVGAGVLAATGITLGVRGFSRSPADALVESVPGMDGQTQKQGPAEEAVRIGEVFEKLDGVPAPALVGVWEGFRGRDFSNIVAAPGSLAGSWSTNGPRVIWSVSLGEGHAGAAVRNGCVYVLDHDEPSRADLLRCFSLADGRELWRRGYKINLKRNHGLSRTVPAVSEHFVVTMGPKCQVMCVNAGTGDFLWGMDLERQFGTRVPDWYTGQCPLIDGDVAVLAPCGTNVFMLGVDCASGRTVWSTPAPGKWLMSHASVAPASFDGKKMYVYAAINGMAGVSAEGEDRGRILWQTEEWKPAVIVPSPIVMPDGRIFVTAGYGAGSMVFQVRREGAGFKVETLRKYGPRQGFASEQQTPVFFQGRLFGILPKDAGPCRNQLACADPEGRILWTSGKETRFGMGPVMVAGDRFLILDDVGSLTMARATTEGFQPMGEAKVLDGQDAWAPFALAGTRLLLRDSKRMVCVELGME